MLIARTADFDILPPATRILTTAKRNITPAIGILAPAKRKLAPAELKTKKPLQ